MEMVTRVAMAIASSQLDEGDSLYDWYALTEEVQDDFLATARAAIEAMREPTEGMLEAAVPEPVHLYTERDTAYRLMMQAATQADRMAVQSKWQSMIDAALSQTIGEK